MGVNDHLSAGPEAYALSRAFERCLTPDSRGLFKPYICPAGVLTLGWGHTNAQGRKFDASARWSQRQCDIAHEEDMEESADVVRRRVKVQLNQHQFDALTCFVHNVGETNFAKSTLLRKLNRGDFDGAAAEFGKWVNGGGRKLSGLVRRRASEALLFQGVADRNYDGKPDRGAARSAEDPEAMPQSVDAPTPDKPLIQSKITQGSTAVIVGEGADILNQVSEAADKVSEVKQKAESIGALDVLGHLVQEPRFLVAVVVVVIAGLVIYWRWRDHQ
ncbi:lysozyme [Bradyrhizobium sp. WSM 1738]|uniref:lysozyme n=1 Tax=Bradyrhizobium hereditatis TaxID=2821405 RepID=UPI001CE376FD|nr:lysozyme [Bradyrhizobium hereditatis]MCA6114237.1 lysozyme [Bradyrhizobium hereditatis]